MENHLFVDGLCAVSKGGGLPWLWAALGCREVGGLLGRWVWGVPCASSRAVC